MFALMLGALVATSTPTGTAINPASVTVTPMTKGRAAPDMATMFKMFDKFFPVQPEPDPARLASARTTVLTMLPPGSFGKSIDGVMGGMFERVLDMRESDFPMSKDKSATKGVRSDQTLHQSLVAKDPFFEERMRLTRAAVSKEFVTFSMIIEPKLRDGLARAVARRFDQRQLDDINRFFATDSGKALGNHFLGLWFDPDLMRSTMAAMPEMMIAMPGSIERIEAATAHLPKLPKGRPVAKEKSSK